MENKNIFAFAGIFALVLFTLSFVSASVSGVSINIQSNIANPVNPGSSYDVEVTVENNNGTTILLEWVNSSSSYNTVWTFLEDNSTLDNGTSADFSATLKIPSDYIGSHGRQLKANVYDNTTGVWLGTLIQTFTVNSSDTGEVYGCTDSGATNYNPSATVDDGSCTYTVVSTFCEEGTEFTGEAGGNLTIKGFQIDNLGEGDDETWNYLDEVEIIVDIKNLGEDDISDITVEIKITDSSGVDVTSDFELDDETIDLGKIKDGDTETATFRIDELAADIDEGTYRVYIRAYEEGNEENECVSVSTRFSNDDKYFEFTVESEYDDPAIIPKGDIFNSLIELKPGQTHEISFYVYNLGDQDEDRVLVQLYNKELGINKKMTFRNLDIGDKGEVDFTITIPDNADGGRYKLYVITYYDYDEGDINDELSYDENSDEDLDETFIINLNVENTIPDFDITITADLLSDAKVGNDLVVEVSVTNNGGEDATFIPTIEAYESWAELTSVEPSVLSVKAGTTETLTLTFNPTKSGTQTFRVVTTEVGGEKFERTVSVVVAEKAGFLTGAFSGIGSTTAYLIGGIVLLLVIIVVVLIVKLAGASKVVSDF